jgi:TRAP-type C4-dicarboxylate transport system permease large subunit
VLFVVASASIFGWLLTVTHVTDAVAEWVLGFTHNPNVFPAARQSAAAVRRLLPRADRSHHAAGADPDPICLKLGIDTVHFGLVMVLNLMIGPAASADGHGAVRALARRQAFVRAHHGAILPWLVPLFATLILCTYVPAVVLWLPRQVLLEPHLPRCPRTDFLPTT